jgi:hypothetical protein
MLGGGLGVGQTMKALSRKTWLAIVICLLAALTLVMWYVKKERELVSSVQLPHASDVDTVVATVYPLWRFSQQRTVTIPPEYRNQIVDAFRPAKPSEYPEGWDRVILARLEIKANDGRAYEVLVCDSGQNPLYFTVNGIRCVRDGPYIAPDGHTPLAECHTLFTVLEEICIEQSSHQKDEKLTPAPGRAARSTAIIHRGLEYLRRSAGR